LAKLTAVIDFGSNSVRLVIFERTSRFGFKIVHESKSRVRIGEGAYLELGVLQQEPMNRAALALSGFNSIIKSFKVRKILAIATSALRDAPNKNIFLNRIKKELGINIKVIDGKTEALLGGIACANLLQLEQKAVTVDIGGGSTEFALIENRKVINTYSLNLGTVRLKELFENSNITEAKSYINVELAKLPLVLYSDLLIGIGGTIRALSKVIQKKEKYPLKRIHGFKYSYQTHKLFFDAVTKMDRENLLKMNFKPERVDVIPWGVLIFNQIINLFQANNIITSGVGIREGLFLKDNLRNMQSRYPDNFNPSIRNILDDFEISNIVGKIQFRVANILFNTLENYFQISKYKNTIANISKLIEIGVKIHFYGNSKNGFQMILDRFIYGISHEESLLIATVIRFSGKNRISEKIYDEFGLLLPTSKDLKSIHSIIYLTKILTLNYSKTINFNLEFLENRLIIRVFDDTLFYMINEKLGTLENLDIQVLQSSINGN